MAIPGPARRQLGGVIPPTAPLERETLSGATRGLTGQQPYSRHPREAAAPRTVLLRLQASPPLRQDGNREEEEPGPEERTAGEYLSAPMGDPETTGDKSTYPFYRRRPRRLERRLSAGGRGYRTRDMISTTSGLSNTTAGSSSKTATSVWEVLPWPSASQIFPYSCQFFQGSTKAGSSSAPSR